MGNARLAASDLLCHSLAARTKEDQVMPPGGCHCGAIRYELPAEIRRCSLCHCSDCRRHSGAPVVAWALVAKDQLKVEGETREYASSEHGRRHFCPKCGTGLFYTSDTIFPGQIDVQLATLDDPDVFVPDAQIQFAERIGWMDRLDEMARFDHFPSD